MIEPCCEHLEHVVRLVGGEWERLSLRLGLGGDWHRVVAEEHVGRDIHFLCISWAAKEASFKLLFQFEKFIEKFTTQP